MKRTSVLFCMAAAALVSLVSSCGNSRTQLVAESDRQRDSLTRIVEAKDSLINAVFADINAITENLARIKSRENLITVSEDPENGRRPVEEINSDIAAIDRLLIENREKITSLRNTAAQLRKANLRIDGLEKMITDLNGQLEEKKSEIGALRDELARMDSRVATLTETVNEQTEQVETLNDQNLELENRLNTVYYIVGSEKELRDAQIINKQGFIGRTLTVGEHGSMESFTQADSRLLLEVPVGHRRVTIVTSHPEGSYELVQGADKMIEKLRITDPVRFWESSKILIVSYK